MDATQKVKSGGFFDVSVGYKVWHNLALGVGYSRAGSKADAAITLSVPDPVFFDRPRSVTASATGLAHTENTVNLMAVWMVPVTDKIDVGVSAGPSIFMLKQELPNSPSITEPGPIVGPIDLSSADKTTAGFNLGVDVTYMLNKRFGVGGLARYTWGSAAITGATNDLKLGGFQIGAGLRTRF
jgi:hypothetical protein